MANIATMILYMSVILYVIAGVIIGFIIIDKNLIHIQLQPIAVTVYAVIGMTMVIAGLIINALASYTVLMVTKNEYKCPVCGKEHQIHIRAKQPVGGKYIYRYCPSTDRVVKVYTEQDIRQETFDGKSAEELIKEYDYIYYNPIINIYSPINKRQKK